MNIDKQIQLALQYHQSGDLQKAEYIFNKILKKQRNNVDILCKLGELYAQIGSMEKSISCFKKAIELDPFFAMAYFKLGDALQEKGNLDEAVTFYMKALELNPHNACIYNNIGIILNEKGQYDEAIKYYQKALQLNPNFETAYNNLGIAFKDKGNLDDAIKYYQKALQLSPTNAVIHYGLSMTLLLDGNFKEGWKRYEWRWKCEEHYRRNFRNFKKPLWNGSDITGRTILLHDEQGCGDGIQFIRYATLVAQRGAKVIVECREELKSLLQNVEGVDQVFACGEQLCEFDLYCPLLSLPLVFDTTLENIPSTIPYITAESTLLHKWQEKVQHDDSKVKIGLVWAGSKTHKKDRFRSCSLEMFAPLSQLTGITLYSLQKGESSQEAEIAAKRMNLIDYTEEINDFSDTAALIESLDLVISVDTAVAHLAGALGKPVWTLLPFVPDWRWMLTREDSPWYPTMRLFRQPSFEEWESVIEKVTDELLKFLSKH